MAKETVVFTVTHVQLDWVEAEGGDAQRKLRLDRALYDQLGQPAALEVTLKAKD